ncbi:type IVB pilus formation outer membrane protein, R64 PilN family [Izhakiella capsodis]|uniref:Type IVB pilus formation outer membrane protein, R64 PilN family n=1 Tax=Izhakiella capsodis TaxID=1367852 RepID=A0A1I4W5S3_9GAMM|nr:secretin N-terminal domain-containing protein [Izhakiella capsodis]SFN08399.1 type IVB pilus formation outer membrane protein, R64 PilN family [Izhakiella capsodis]
MIHKTSYKKSTILITLMISLSACSTEYKKTQKEVDAQINKTTVLFRNANNGEFKKNYNMVTFHKNGLYIGLKPFIAKQGESLPVNVEADGVKLFSSRKMSLNDIANLITTFTGIPASIDEGTVSTESRDGTDTDMYKELNEAVNKSITPQQQVNLYDNLPGMTVDYSGELSGFLKLVSSHFNVSWQYRDGIIFFSKYAVKTFTINTLPVKTTSQSKMDMGLTAGGSGSSGGQGTGSNSDSSGGGSSSSGGSTSNSLSASDSSKSSLNLDFWKDITQNLDVILHGNGSVSVSEGLASITVSTSPDIMVNVENYINQLNRSLRQEIAVNVSIYNVTLNDDSDWNYSLTSMFSALKGRISGHLSLFSKDPGDPGIEGTTENNSSFIVNMLDNQGKVSVLNSANVITMSGQPVPLQVSNTRGYVSSIGTTVNNNTSQTNLDVSLIDTGFFLNVLPRVLRDGKIMLQYSISLSSLAGNDNGFDSFSVDKKKIQLPDINQRSFIEQNILKNDNTLVVAGYKTSNLNSYDAGIGNPKFKLLGGDSSGKGSKEIIVICITPTTLNLGEN